MKRNYGAEILHEKHMARLPIAQHPDNHFVYADDLTPVTPREAIRLFLGSMVIFAVVFAFLFLLGIAQ